MADITSQKFLSGYGALLTAAWGDAALKARLKSDPTSVLKEYGLDPQGASVTITAPGAMGADTTPESQVKLWNDGVSSGSIVFYFPEEVPEGAENMEISEEALEAVAGGDACCCCSPCCCC
jgi:hypothetical protein